MIQFGSETEFLEKISEDIAVVFFVASWCYPCNQMLNLFDDKFFKIDADDDFGITEKFSIKVMPTVLFFKKGNLVKRISGYTTPEVVEAEILGLQSQKDAV